EHRTYCPHRCRLVCVAFVEFGGGRQPAISVQQLALVYRICRCQLISKRFYPILPAGNDFEKIGHKTKLPI
ncbi:Rhodanese-related sulfurtransferase, partial [Methylomonas fluvii]